MFQTIGRARQVNRHRQLGAGMLAVLLLMTATGFSALSGGQEVELLDIESVKVEFIEISDDAPPPPPPQR